MLKCSSRAQQRASSRTWELWLAFLLGFSLLVFSQLFGYLQAYERGQVVGTGEFARNAVDLFVFLIVVYLLKRDIARRRKAEAALYQANEELRKVNEFKSELLAVVAHDLKNPIASIQGLAHLLKAGQGVPGALEETARHIEDVSEHMLEQIHQLLETAALESAGVKLSLAFVDLAEVMGAVVRDELPTAQAKGQRIETEIDGVLIAQVDVVRVRRVFCNLLENAVKFSPRGRTIKVELRAEGTIARMTIEDEGPGMSADDLAHAFERFRRLSALPTGGESSTGLGLWIVREIVRLHHGQVRVISPGLGQGATFCVELPLADGAPETEIPDCFGGVAAPAPAQA